ncbi:MAG TPA: hypothetical protein VH087_10720 [Thermoanaerobaculia bacterium]|jgi:hypothetical protein|nr:hypothetical protein [Thermoanaerobaculia bacterium]
MDDAECLAMWSADIPVCASASDTPQPRRQECLRPTKKAWWLADSSDERTDKTGARNGLIGVQAGLTVVGAKLIAVRTDLVLGWVTPPSGRTDLALGQSNPTAA